MFAVASGINRESSRDFAGGGGILFEVNGTRDHLVQRLFSFCECTLQHDVVVLTTIAESFSDNEILGIACQSV